VPISVAPDHLDDVVGDEPRLSVHPRGRSTASSTHVLVEQHPEQQGQRVAAEQLVSGGSWVTRSVGTDTGPAALAGR
jgi:hypothetical protein